MSMSCIITPSQQGNAAIRLFIALMSQLLCSNQCLEQVWGYYFPRATVIVKFCCMKSKRRRHALKMHWRRDRPLCLAQQRRLAQYCQNERNVWQSTFIIFLTLTSFNFFIPGEILEYIVFKTNQNGEEVRDLKGSSAKEKVESREKVLSEKMRSCAMF